MTSREHMFAQCQKIPFLATWQLQDEPNNSSSRVVVCQQTDNIVTDDLVGSCLVIYTSDLGSLFLQDEMLWCSVCVQSWFYCFTGFHLIRFSFVVQNWPWEREKKLFEDWKIESQNYCLCLFKFSTWVNDWSQMLHLSLLVFSWIFWICLFKSALA